MSNLEQYLFQTIDNQQRKEAKSVFLVIEGIIIFILYFFIPEAIEVKSFLKLIDQWNMQPITEIQRISSSESCPYGYQALTAPFYGTNRYCMTWYTVKMGSCSKKENEDDNGYDDTVLWTKNFDQLGGFKICYKRDEQKRTYYDLQNDPLFQQGLYHFNQYSPEQNKLSNSLHNDNYDRFYFSVSGSDEPIVDLKLSFLPYPCLIENGERYKNKREISRIFAQPNSCKEKPFLSEDESENKLFKKVDNFQIQEYRVLDENGIFPKIDNYNPHRHDIKTIYDRDLFKNQYYHMFYQNYMKYSHECNSHKEFKVSEFVRLIKKFQELENLNYAILLVLFLAFLWTCWMNQHKHQILFKFMTLGYIFFAYYSIMAIFIQSDESHKIAQFIERKCIPDETASQSLLNIEEGMLSSRNFMMWTIPTLLIMKMVSEYFINF
ncbi:UNKNOWN [Stylonychia lemnae]|uniref:Transmembrane protein n=1 Tax=Stylonychia lemnae TaxID=5949 RepID=A0A077ZWK9_STYLE|nr:UNKNOWN [Stylonychia lemnae]|eukprot:CDW72851.1 UNKNOWN [Stylonychia lemnae]